MRVRSGSAAVAMAAVLILSACDGDDPAATDQPSSPAAAPSPTASESPAVVIDRAMFRPRVQEEALKLDCSGGGFTSVIADSVANPDEKPLERPDALTDGLAALAVRVASHQSHSMNPDWDDAQPPTPAYLFPREPAASMRAVVRFVSASGDVVAAVSAHRHIARGAWIEESVRWCSWRAPR